MLKRLSVNLVLSLLAATAGAAPLNGRLATPTAVVPALTVYAWSLTSAQLYSVSTEGGQDTFALDVPPGRYWLFATPADPGAPPLYGAHTDFSACTHTGAHRSTDCDRHTLRPVTVGRQRDDGIDLTDWHLDDTVTRELDRILGRPPGETKDDAQFAAPKFSEYPAPPFAGRRTTTLAVGGDARIERDGELLAAALASPVNFAGRTVLVRLGCGAGCEFAALVDVATGRVAYPSALAALPASSECSARGALLFRRDSRLVTITGRDRAELVTRYFVWDPDSGVLKLIASLASTLDERCVRIARG